MEAYILAGGKSSRRGSDKGLLIFKNKTLIERIIGQLHPLFQKIVIISNNPEYTKFGLEVIEDLEKGLGPAGGICTGLQHTQSKSTYFVSCDMPFITTNAIRFIIDNSEPQGITLPFHAGKIEPLFGVYSRNCLKKWEQLIQQGIIKLQTMVFHFQLEKIDTTNNPLFSDLLFTNINDKSDLAKALQKL